MIIESSKEEKIMKHKRGELSIGAKYLSRSRFLRRGEKLQTRLDSERVN